MSLTRERKLRLKPQKAPETRSEPEKIISAFVRNLEKLGSGKTRQQPPR